MPYLKIFGHLCQVSEHSVSCKYVDHTLSCAGSRVDPDTTSSDSDDDSMAMEMLGDFFQGASGTYYAYGPSIMYCMSLHVTTCHYMPPHVCMLLEFCSAT